MLCASIFLLGKPARTVHGCICLCTYNHAAIAPSILASSKPQHSQIDPVQVMFKCVNASDFHACKYTCIYSTMHVYLYIYIYIWGGPLGEGFFWICMVPWMLYIFSKMHASFRSKVLEEIEFDAIYIYICVHFFWPTHGE